MFRQYVYYMYMHIYTYIYIYIYYIWIYNIASPRKQCVQNHITPLYQIGLAAAALAAAANPLYISVWYYFVLSLFSGVDMLYIYIIYVYICIWVTYGTWWGDLGEITSSPHTISKSALYDSLSVLPVRSIVRRNTLNSNNGDDGDNRQGDCNGAATTKNL